MIEFGKQAAMSIRFRCKKCNQKYELDDDCSGDTLNCVRCKSKMLVPQESEIPQNASIKKAAALANSAPAADDKNKIQEIRIASNTSKNKAPDDIIFRCKICNQKYRLPKNIGGQLAECAKCKKNMIVPRQSDNAPASAAPKENVIFWCKSCGQKYRLSKELAGQEGECTKCRKVFVIPGESENSASVPEPRKAIEKATAIASFIPVVDKNKDKIQKISVHSTTSKNKSPDDIIFRCKICNQKYRLPKDLGGQLAECAKCKKKMFIPRQSDNASASAAPKENVIFWCKSCGQKYRLPKELAGQEGECAKCKKIFEVPAQSESKHPAGGKDLTPAQSENGVAPAKINLQSPGRGEKRFESRSDLPHPPKHFLSKTPATKKTEPPKPASAPPVMPKAGPAKYPERDAEKTQTSISMTKTARTMVKYVLEIPERNFFFVSFSLIIDWLMQSGLFHKMPRKLVIFLFIFITLLTGIITYSSIKIYQRNAKNALQINVMCASCKLCETKPVKNIFAAKCSKCKGQLGFQWKCGYCNRIFTRIERKSDDNPIQYDKIDTLKPPVCPFCNSTAVKYFAPPKPPEPSKKINIRRN
jgi:hypothetical protein